MITDAWGIDDGWWGVEGQWHQAPAATTTAVRAAMGGDPDDPQPPPGRPVWIMRPGETEPLATPCDLHLEDGQDLGLVDRLPPDLPLGIHDLLPDDGGPLTHLIVSPGRCHLPAGLRTWGAVAQVPSCRSRRSWGIGDLADVAMLADSLRRLGAGVLGLSPLHAPQPVGAPGASPYYPSSRRWRSPLLLRIDELDGAQGDPLIADLGGRARGLLADPRIDRATAAPLHRQALDHLWTRQPRTDPAFDAWRERQGEDLERWTTFAALAERHGATWQEWPAELRRPTTAAVQRSATQLTDRRSFHAWVQYQLERQLLAARPDGMVLLQDLAVGIDPRGGDAWAMQDQLALDMTVGAPPDAFAPSGQDWGLPPFVPWRLRDAGYRPLAALLRAAMTTGGVRIDHVMGLTRLFWVPPGSEPTEGTYVRFAGRELLEVVALVSAQTGALVVGEDLGTVEPELRQALADSGILSTRLVWFEDQPPEAYPSQAMAAVTTHDLPTVAGVWTGADTAELERLGRLPDPGAGEELYGRLAALSGLDPDRDDAASATVAVHRRLAQAPSALATATLEDACGVVARPNIPGTTDDERANWSRALPVLVEDLAAQPLARDVFAALSRRD